MQHWIKASGIVVVFACGLGAGLAVPRSGSSQGEGNAPAVLPVSGHDRGAPLAQPAPPFSPISARTEDSPRGAAGKDARELRSSRKVAQGALAFTVFVRAGTTYGAGVLVDAAGHVITCRHVIEGERVLSVSFSDSGPYPATVVDSDSELDLALLKIEPGHGEPATLASVTSVQMGDDIFGMGAPRKLRFSLSRGLVSYVGRPFGKSFYLQTDLPTNGGNSGGPVMNDRGEVVGITSFIYRNTQGLSFALPIDYAQKRFSHHLGSASAVLARTDFSAWERGAEQRGAVR